MGMSVLVLGGAGALGQAAISIALAFHCEVFTTVSDIRKKRFLLKLFPELTGILWINFILFCFILSLILFYYSFCLILF